MALVARKAVGLLVAMAATASLTTTAFSQAGEPLTVTPTQGAQLTEVTVSGSNCRGGNPSSVAGALVGPPGTGSVIEGTPFQSAVAGTVFTPTVDGNGNWTATFVVPPYIDAGEYQVRAICKASANATTGAEYQPRPFTVLAAAASPVLSVSPREARAGQAVTLNVSGTLCVGPNAEAQVEVREEVPESQAGDQPLLAATFRPDAQGSWSGTVTIPATARAATYRVGAFCQRGGQLLFIYSPVAKVVLTRAAAPTPAPRISLTG